MTTRGKILENTLKSFSINYKLSHTSEERKETDEVAEEFINKMVEQNNVRRYYLRKYEEFKFKWKYFIELKGGKNERKKQFNKKKLAMFGGISLLTIALVAAVGYYAFLM